MIEIYYNGAELNQEDPRFKRIVGLIPTHLRMWIKAQAEYARNSRFVKPEDQPLLLIKIGIGLGVDISLKAKSQVVFNQKQDVPSGNQLEEHLIVLATERGLEHAFTQMLFDLFSAGFYHSKRVQEKLRMK